MAADKKVETARFDGKPVLFARVDDGIHKPEELIKKIAHGEAPVYHAEGGAQAAAGRCPASDSFGRSLYKHLMNGVSHMLPFVVGGGIMIALAFLLDDYTIDPSNFGMNTPVAAFFKTVGSAAFGYMLPILSGFHRHVHCGPSGSGSRLCGRCAGHERHQLCRHCQRVRPPVFPAASLRRCWPVLLQATSLQLLKKITEKLPASLNGIRPMLIYPLGGMLIIGAVMCGINPVMGIINTAMTDCLNAMGGTSKVLLGAIVAGMMSIDMGGPFNKAAYVFGTAALASGNYEVMAAVMVGGMVPPIAIALSTTFCPKKWTPRRAPQRHRELRHGPLLCHRGRDPLCGRRPAACPAQLRRRLQRWPVRSPWRSAAPCAHPTAASSCSRWLTTHCSTVWPWPWAACWAP